MNDITKWEGEYPNEKEIEMLQDAKLGWKCESCGQYCDDNDEIVEGAYPDIKRCSQCADEEE